MTVVKVRCDWCGREYEKYECFLKGKSHHFCSRQCLADFSSKSKNPDGFKDLKDYTNISKHMTELNQQLNPNRMTYELKEKMRIARLGKGECRGYSKIHGQPAHRVVAEQILGRKLNPGEVVHHRDGNPYTNAPDNLYVFASNAEHVRFHAESRWFLKQIKLLDETGGDAR